MGAAERAFLGGSATDAAGAGGPVGLPRGAGACSETALMDPQEKKQLIALLADARHWCQGAEAHDAAGQAVTYSDPDATAWDLTGAACHLFGWRRACELFLQIERHFQPRAGAGGAGREAEITAMVVLQSWNDDPRATHPELLALLERLPVSNRPGNGDGPSGPVPNGGSEGSGS